MFKRFKEKKYFKKKFEGVQKMIWDYEFKRSKTRSLREAIRQKYDQDKSRMATLLAKIGTENKNPTMGKGDIARLDDDKVRLEKEIEKWEEQLKNLDLEVNGSKQTNEYPEGAVGINQTLDSLRELQIMLKEYIKRI